MSPPKWWLLFTISIHIATTLITCTKQTYIIHIDTSAKPQHFTTHTQWYHSILQSVSSPILSESEASDCIIYTYETAFQGIAAQLTEQEATQLHHQNGVVSLFPDTVLHLHTTRSPTFLGLEPESTSSSTTFSNIMPQNDVVVGVLDTGIWPESPSFNDSGMSRAPPHWKGACETGRGFSTRHCSNKIVGARTFYRGYEAAAGRINEKEEFKSARDQDGHGTHTAATVAGSHVSGANLMGYGYGTARVMAPGARIAAYKVCWKGGCFSSDIVRCGSGGCGWGECAFDFVGGGVSSYYRDSLSIATFGAMEKGVFVSCSAGNGGPDPISLTNVSPWVATVGASTMDRDFTHSHSHMYIVGNFPEMFLTLTRKLIPTSCVNYLIQEEGNLFNYGERKLEIKLIEDKPKRHTVFTKRRQGLIKKADKFFADSGSAGSVIVFSQAGNCFVYGHPVVETVLRSYIAVGIQTAVTGAQWRICEELGKEGWSEMIQGLAIEEVIELLAEMEDIERKLQLFSSSYYLSGKYK